MKKRRRDKHSLVCRYQDALARRGGMSISDMNREKHVVRNVP